MRNFKELRVWQEAMQLTQEIYALTKTFPSEEVFGLTAQLRRASVSISSNIAEGCGRDTTADFVRFLRQALGSCREVESQLILANRLQLAGDSHKVIELTQQCETVGKMIYGLMRSLTGNTRPVTDYR